MNHKLQIVAVEENSISTKKANKGKTLREETQARYERQWHQNPEQFNACRNAKERNRIQRTFQLINENISLEGLLVADLGCGNGELAKKLRDKGAQIHAVDIAKNALKTLENEPNIQTIHACIPNTHLEDDCYDLVLCTELIGHISPREHRLFFNELARIVKRNGYIICSTNIDIYSEDALENFITLAETELEIIKWKFSYHRWFIRLANFFQVSQNSKLSLALGSIERMIKQSSTLLKTLEKVSMSDHSFSHIILFARRKPLAHIPHQTSPQNAIL